MRDPERIPRIVAKLEALWKLNPDMRLGQLLANVAWVDNPQRDLWSIEDEFNPTESVWNFYRDGKNEDVLDWERLIDQALIEGWKRRGS